MLDARYSMLARPVLLKRRWLKARRSLQGCWMLDTGEAGFAEASAVKGAAVVAGILDARYWN